MKKWSSTKFSLTERALVGATLAFAAANACTVSASRLLIDTQYVFRVLVDSNDFIIPLVYKTGC